MLSPLTRFRRNKAAVALVKEARRRGMSLSELKASMSAKEFAELIESLLPRPDVTAWGLVPRSALVDAPSSGVPSIEAAVSAAADGNWKPAAELLAESYGDWDLRARAVLRLGSVAADDDGWLATWRAASPDDTHIAAVDCEALVQLAWQLRGGALAADTSAERFADFRRVLVDAETAAERATEVIPGDPTPWATLVTVARGRAYDQEAFEQVWQGVTDRAPLHRTGHESALQYWCAKWYGSHEQMFDFAVRAAALSPSLSVLMVQAAYEKDQKDGDRSVWRQPGVQNALDTLLRWLDTDGADSVGVRDDLGWAAAALVWSNRAAEALPVFTLLGANAGGAPWRYFTSPAKTFNDYRVLACRAT